MQLRFLTTVVAGALALSAAGPAGSDAADAMERTHLLMDRFKTVEAAPEGKSLSSQQVKANQKAFRSLDELFDFPAITAGCLGASAGRFSATQKREFGERLTDILRRQGYSKGGGAFRAGQVTDEKPIARGDQTRVPLNITYPKEDMTLSLEFVWSSSGKVVDIVIDGESLTKDYQNQIGRIVAKNGVKDLLRRLAEKQKALAPEGK